MTQRDPKAPSRSTAAKRDEQRWRQLCERDGSAEGKFIYAVRTTGVYCRPTCASRRPRVENVEFFSTVREAAAAGYRACKRCRPDEAPRPERERALVLKLCRLIETRIASGDAAPSLDELAGLAKLSVFHMHRLFKAVTGLTPKTYAASLRAKRVRGELSKQASVTRAIYEAGFGSSGRFYASSQKILGMKPSAYRAGGNAEKIRFAVGKCSLGAILVAFTERGLCAISLGDDHGALEKELEQRFRKAKLERADATYERQLRRVIALVEKPATGLNLPLDVRGTAFQERVWRALAKIPPGQTLTYTELATIVGAPRAVRAVASACGANPLAVAIPCHRVIGRDGALAGYRWGLDRKRELLDREAES
ncbi:MAG TPA: bifunctional DNA-binding transcriptional regulator/O6-methylguanine-DNA methyltransferase Ada [Polyangiaceae bacterium]|nr:bifunctional DNA-binding transcriptional regulator/O6-methylguanine-DNA methyltransferase Ada [Polyangiaceae bacterium]